MVAFLPGLIILGYADIHRRYLNSLGRNTVPLIALAIGTFAHYFISKHLVITLQLGIKGTGYAGILLWSTILLVQVIYSAMVEEFRETLMWPDRRSISLDGLSGYMKLARPQILLSCSDWWAAELMILVSGMLGKQQLTAMIVIVNIGGMMNRVALGLDQAATTLIGRKIGAGDIESGQSYFAIFNIYSGLFAGTCSMAYFILRKEIIGLYVADEQLTDAIALYVWIMCLNTGPELFKGYLKGVFKAFAMQHKALWINMSGCWLVQPILVWLFAFKADLRLKGIFISKALMEIYLLVFSITIIQMQSWDQVVENARERQAKEFSTTSSEDEETDENFKIVPEDNSDGDKN